MALAKAQAAKLNEIMNDPIKWAQAFLRTFNPKTKKIEPWTARWYQVEMLRDTHTRKVYRCGRRIGKCLPGDTKILDPNTGERIPVEVLYNRGKAHLVTMKEDYKLSPHFTNEILDNGIKEVFRVTTKTGRHIDATGNHPLFTAKGWQAIDFLKPGDKVALAGNMGYFGNHQMNENEIKLLAYMIGDGNCSSKTIRFCTASDAIRKEMERAVNYFDCELVQYKSNRDIDYNIVKKHNRNNRMYPNTIREVLEKHEVYGKTAHYKVVPKDIFKLSKNDTALFLSRLYATDGWAHSRNNKQQIGYCSVSRELISDIQHLLLKFGINSYVNTKKAKYKDTIKISYQLLITNSNDVIKFYKEIGIFSKEEAAKKAYETALINNKYDSYLPKEILEFVEEDRIKQGLSKKDLCKSEHARLRLNYDIQRSRLKEFAEVLNNEDLMNFADGEFIFDEIVSIESLGEKQTYDLSVPFTMNFVADDFITHNTETMVVEMLYLAYTRKNFRVLMAAPYENQIRNMFTRLNELIAESPLVKQAVVSTTKNPAKIEFANGSMILGFTTGDDAASVRGQRADWIFIDEIDFMSEYCFEVVAAIAIERSEIGITCSSTPLGKRSHFYRMCTDPKMNYSQHFHPSTHNPNWNDQMEAELRAQLTAEGYVHEVLAEFGTQETGVFDKDKIDASMNILNYAYNDLDFFQQKHIIENNLEQPEMLMYNRSFKAPYNTFRTMGVDWDKYGASSSILILDYDANIGKFKVFKRVEVPRSEYSYDAAVNLIIELNEIYNPSWIYCDAGSGEYQIERLHIYGDENPKSGLKNKVKRWQFSNKLDVMDPITKEVEKKPLKPFMVNQLQIAFERDRMILSPYDNVLSKQLVDYEVEKITEAGIPKYTSENEHFVDALGLAYLAMVLEFKNLTGVIQDVKTTSDFKISHKQIGGTGFKSLVETRVSTDNRITDFYQNTDFSELRGDRQSWVKVDMDYRSSKAQMKVNRFGGGLRGGNSRGGSRGFSRF